MERTYLLGRTLTTITLILMLGGCATSSLFQSYPSQAQSFQQALSMSGEALNPTTIAVLTELNEERESADAMLYMMERGRINQLNSSFADSKTDFELVINNFEEQDLASTIDVSGTMAEGASLLTNDNAIPYQGAGYERVFTHHHQAFNYLGEKDLDGASVEFRKVALEQRILLEKHEKEIAEAHEEAEENDIDINTLSTEFSGLDNVAGKVKSSFQNAYTFYASGAFWESRGDLNAAWVDYKKAFEINSNNSYLKQDIARIAKKLGEKPEQKDTNEAATGQGTVVVFFEDGFVPAKSEIKVPVPTFDGGFISLAFPFYETEFWPVSSTLRVVDDQFNDLGNSEIVVDVAALAVKDLKEQIPKLLVRQALRGFAKYQLQKQSGNHGGVAGQLLASLYNVISESADRRSWLTLPHTAQVMRFNLDAGQRELNFSTVQNQAKLKLEVVENRTTFIRVVNANNQLITQAYAL